MSLFDLEERLLLPEWSKSGDAVKTQEVKSLKNKKLSTLNDNTDFLYESFCINKTLGSAIELLNIAYIENRDAEARIAARFIVQGFDLPPQILQFAKFILSGSNYNSDTDGTLNPTISVLRAWLKANPKDALGWVDLARAYVSIGKITSAENAITVATNLFPHHRWVVRVASRFYVNNNQNDKAHYLLSKQPTLKEDPWLLSAEIAVAESYKRPLKMVSQAKKIIESDIFSPSHLTELESSIATIELSNGAIKKAKKLYISSLRIPNDNSLAQAKWAERNANISNLVSSDLLFSKQGANEAKLWERYYSYDLPSAIAFGVEWFCDEPYTTQPALIVTYLSSVLDDYQLCKEYANKGLNIDKFDTTLILNKIFADLCLLNDSYLENNSTDKWEITLKNFLSDDDDNIIAHANANLGLLYYRTGKYELGREYYTIACEYFLQKKNASGILASMNHYREAVLANVPWQDDVFFYMEQVYINSPSKKEPALAYYYIKI